MRRLYIERTAKIDVNFTPDDWQLYTSSMDCTQATKALNKTLKESVNSGDSRPIVRQKMHKVMNAYSKFGAYDSEPYWFLEATLDDIFGEER